MCILCREPRGFAFVQFVDGYDASEASYYKNGQIFAGKNLFAGLRHQSVNLTILLHLAEGMQNTRDYQEVHHRSESEMITIVGHILVRLKGMSIKAFAIAVDGPCSYYRVCITQLFKFSIITIQLFVFPLKLMKCMCF